MDKTNAASLIAKNIESRMKRKGWRKADLGRAANLNSPNVNRLLGGKHIPTVPTLIRIADAFRIPVARLLAEGGKS